MTGISKFFITIAAASTIASTVAARETYLINDGWSFISDRDTIAVSVRLPHSWNTDAYATRNYHRGTGVYTRDLTIPQSAEGQRIYLKFDGAANSSAIAIDGKTVATHIGAYSPHIADITPYVNAGRTHRLSVTVDNADRDIPPYSADFTFMGGLYRDAGLMIVPATHLDISAGPSEGFTAVSRQNADGSWNLGLTGTMVNDAAERSKVTLTITIADENGHEIARKDKKFDIKGHSGTPFAITIDNLNDIVPWSPEQPALYRVNAVVSRDGRETDHTQSHVGFRTCGFDDKGRFILNGKPYKLRGMCRHQDQYPMGTALSDEQHRRDMQMIKNMGANFVRISHYPQDDAVLEMCDRLGLIAWEEIPVIDHVPESEQFADNCETMLREMIRAHRNHPAVVMWGYMNEILLRMPSDNRDETMRRTTALARRLEKAVRDEDPTRLSTMAFHGSDVYHDAGLSDITDVKGWNLYQGWYGGELDGFEQFLDRQHSEHPDHRIIVSEYGAGSDLRLHSPDPEPFDFSIEYQQKYLEHYLPVIESRDYVAGASHWNFIDFSSANRAESMPHINNKGLVTNSRRAKDVYHYYRASWNANDTVAHIAVRDWADRTELTGSAGCVTRPVKIYTNLPIVTLTVNGRPTGTKAVQNHTAVFDAGLKDGLNTLVLTAEDGTVLDAATIWLKALRHDGRRIDTGTDELAVNVGSGCYFRSDDSGLTWLPDRQYTSGSLYGHIGGRRAVSQDEIMLTDDGPLLQRCLVDLDSYRFDVVPGSYEVELSFADLASPSALSAYMLGSNAGTGDIRATAMDVSINGKTVERDVAPGNEAGVKTMVKKRYLTEVDDNGVLEVRFNAADGATTSLSAIKIRKL
ncbi:MAG: glycoside hydrolase family 2 TIM barrel-domain containing protein [Bacteroidales bacterium]|nr:glycoside hydrolase family 2 TIM barrel-domain containing protein [Bacteroidales bacterium]